MLELLTLVEDGHEDLALGPSSSLANARIGMARGAQVVSVSEILDFMD